MPKRRHPQTNAERVIATLDPDDLQQLRDACDRGDSAAAIHRWLRDRDPSISYSSVLNWLNREYPQGQTSSSINQKLKVYRGINPHLAHASSLAAVIELTDALLALIRSPSGLSVADLNPSQLSNLSDLLREQRQSAIALAAQQAQGDRRELELAGAYRIAEIINRLAEGDPHAAAISGYVRAAIAQLEHEIR